MLQHCHYHQSVWNHSSVFNWIQLYQRSLILNTHRIKLAKNILKFQSHLSPTDECPDYVTWVSRVYELAQCSAQTIYVTASCHMYYVTVLKPSAVGFFYNTFNYKMILHTVTNWKIHISLKRHPHILPIWAGYRVSIVGIVEIKWILYLDCYTKWDYAKIQNMKSKLKIHHKLYLLFIATYTYAFGNLHFFGYHKITKWRGQFIWS